MKYQGLLAALFVATLTAGVLGQTNKAEVLLGTGLHQEDVELNCTEAIKTYQKVIQEKSAPKRIAAQAQLRIGSCQEKLGLPEARTSYDLVLNRYGDQAELVAQARERLGKLGGVPKAGLRVERVLEDGPSVNTEGRTSADGRYYVAPDRSGDLLVHDLQAGTRKLLKVGATVSGWPENPLPSPDGKRIAYRFGEEDDSSIRLINADGTNTKVLLRDHHDNYLAAWSPDGKHLAALHDNGDRTQTIVLISTTNGEIKPLKSMGPQDGYLGGFSPDGRFLVYAKNNDPKDGDGGVFTVAVDGSVVNRLVEGTKLGRTIFDDPLWSPDGQRVIFQSNRSSTPALWSIGVKNGQPEGQLEQLRVNIDKMRSRVLARDGSLYYMTQEILVEAYSAGFDPAAMKVLTPTPITDRAVGNNRGPELSPDGTSVAFIRRRGSDPWAIVVRSLEAGAEERIVGTLSGSGAYGARTLQWFPDGRSLLVIDALNERKRFRKIDVDSHEEKVVFDAPWTVWTGTVSYDGKDLFYSARGSGTEPLDFVRLVKRNWDTGEERDLFEMKSPGVGLFGLVASPDGASVAFGFNHDDGHRGLFVLSTEGGKPRELYRSNLTEAWPKEISWTKDSRTLVVVAIGKDGETLYAIPAAGGSLKPLGLTMEEIAVATISPDSRRIVFGGRTVREELWVVRNLLSDLEKPR